MDSNSSSSQSTSTNNYDQRKVLGEGALNLEGGSSITSTSNLSSVDSHAVSDSGNSYDSHAVSDSGNSYDSHAVTDSGNSWSTDSHAVTDSGNSWTNLWNTDSHAVTDSGNSWTNQVDNSFRVGNGSQVATDGSTITNITNSLDGEVVNHALDVNGAISTGANRSMLDALKGAFGFGSDAMKGAFGFGSDALTFAANNDALSAQATAAAYSGAQSSIDRTVQQALGSNMNLMAAALGFANQQSGAAMSTLSNTEALLQGAYSDAKGTAGNVLKVVTIVAVIAGIAYVARKG